MVRIQDSQSWHRGSIPLSTTHKGIHSSRCMPFCVMRHPQNVLYTLHKIKILSKVASFSDFISNFATCHIFFAETFGRTETSGFSDIRER